MRRSVYALLGSVFSATTASMALTTVLGKQVYDLTGDVFDLGLLGLAEFTPAALLVLVTGSVADRHDRRRVAAIAELAEAVVAIALAWYVASNPTSATPIFLMVITFGIARAFAAPASRALPSDIVPPDRLPWVVARNAGTWQAAIIVGPVLGGFLFAVEPWLPYVAVAALLVLAAVGVTLVTVERVVEEVGPVRASWHDALEGLRFIRHQPTLLGAISLDLFAVLFGGAVALLPAIAKDRLGVGAVGLGWLRAAGGIGAAVVTLRLAIRPVHRAVGRVLLAAVAAFGAFTIVLGVTRSYAVAFVALMALSGADSVSVFIRATLVPLATPPSKRGRVLAVENVFIGASNELGAFESGTVGRWLGAPVAIVTGGVATLLVACTWWFLFPALRDVDKFPETAS